MVGWVVGWLVRWFVGGLVRWLVGWLGDWMVGWLVGWLAGWLVGWLVRWLICWLLGLMLHGNELILTGSIFKKLEPRGVILEWPSWQGARFADIDEPGKGAGE